MNYLKYCKTCKNNCCIYPDETGFIFCGIEDAKIIHEKTKLPYNEFLLYTPLKKKTIKLCSEYHDKNSESSLRMRLLKENKLLRIKTTNDGRCVFLDSSDKCTIYENRPLICKIYPYWFRKKGTSIQIVPHEEVVTCKRVIKEKIGNSEKKELIFLAKKIIFEAENYSKNIGIFSKTFIY
ncbi:MAG: YkgJ family cysteine cluster protein [archaeon]